MIIIKTPPEITLMREGGRILAKVLREVIKATKKGVSTKELDELAERLIRKFGGEPAFLNYQTEGEEIPPFPATLCTSVNQEVVHAIPSYQRILKEGDLVGLDIGMDYKGFCTDMAKTVGVGKISPKAKKLIEVTRKALVIGIRKVKPGNFIGDIGAAIQQYVEKKGFSVVRQLVGHGIGKKVHEEPRIPNYGEPRTGPKLEKGMTLAIEPMVNIGKDMVKTAADGWTIVTDDKSLSAHFEHTVVVTKKGYEILTDL